MPSGLVFGGSGQLGVAVAERLLALGWRVSVVTHDRRVPPGPMVDRGVRLLDGTGKSRAAVIGEIDAPIDAVFDPTTYTDADAQDLLQGRSRFGGLVVVSSASVYVDAQGRSMIDAAETGFPDFRGPIVEDTATVAPGPRTYATRKVAMERALFDAGLAVSILRPCAVYGKYATHPREWCLIKRALDRRKAIPVAYAGKSVFHTSSARSIASLAAACMSAPEARVLNAGDKTALSVEEIAAAITDATRLHLPLAPFDGPPIGPSHVGSTPWSAANRYVLDTTRAAALCGDYGEYREQLGEVCAWILGAAGDGDWRSRFTGFTRYGYDPFDYAAEDGFLAAA